ncbi:MAG: hypothetical protein MUF68_09405 [Cyclobacteriaceae bacterium]|nr:hypothetical protein [Cyclobacteriaceae bacterium]
MYKYNGQKWQGDFGYDMYDMPLRDYDPAIARWVVLDPVIHHSQSTYSGFNGNPVLFADPTGGKGQMLDENGARKYDDNGNYIWRGDRVTPGEVSMAAYGSSGGSPVEKMINKINGLSDAKKATLPPPHILLQLLMAEESSGGNWEKMFRGMTKDQDRTKRVRDKKRGVAVWKKEKEEQDNNYNFFYKEKDLILRRGAEYLDDGGADENTIVINSHGGDDFVSSPVGNLDAEDLHAFLYKNNDLYKYSMDHKTEIKINIEACKTGNILAKELSKLNPHAVVTAPTTNIVSLAGINIYLRDDGVYRSYKNGRIKN